MKFILLALLLSNYSLAQDTIKYNLSNTISGSENSNTKQINLSLSGNNNFIYGKYNFFNTSSYSGSWTTKKIAEEISHKSNITYGKIFFLYMFTHSLTRSISLDNSIGLGYVHWWKYASLSYGAIYEMTNYSIFPTLFVFRHSIRAKFNYNNIILIEYYYQPNVLKFNDIIITGNAKFTLFQGKKASIIISDIINYRSLSTTKMIHSATLGLNINIKK